MRRARLRVPNTKSLLDKLYRLVHEQAIEVALGGSHNYEPSLARVRWQLVQAGFHPGEVVWEEMQARSSADALLRALT